MLVKPIINCYLWL